MDCSDALDTSVLSQGKKVVLDIGMTAMREQVQFMSSQLKQAQEQLATKEMLLQRIEADKREAMRKSENLESLTFELQEKLAIA